MKTPIQIVERMVKDYPNDMELGARIRWYIKWLREPKNKDMGNFPIRVITGNSLLMKKIVSTAVENLRFKKSSINTHNGSIVVVE